MYCYVHCVYIAGIKETCFWDVFLGGFQQPLYEGIPGLGYFQPSTLAWLLGISWWWIPPLQGLLWELLPPCIFDVAGGRVWCLKRQGEAVVQIWGKGRGTPAQIFQFLAKSISGCFSNMMVKYELILTKLTGRNNQFSFCNFHHFLKCTNYVCIALNQFFNVSWVSLENVVLIWKT